MIGLVDVAGSRELVELDEVVFEPATPGALVDELGLDLAVIDDPSLLHVDQEDFAGLETPLFADALSGNGEHADLAGHDDQVVAGDVITAGAEAVAVEDSADLFAVGE